VHEDAIEVSLRADPRGTGKRGSGTGGGHRSGLYRNECQGVGSLSTPCPPYQVGAMGAGRTIREVWADSRPLAPGRFARVPAGGYPGLAWNSVIFSF
jgi:hypothetical protein